MNSVKRLTFIILALALACVSAKAQSVSVQANSQVVQGRNFTVTFTITNGEGQVTKDMAPKLPGCTLLYGPGRSTMHSVQIVNGRQASSVSVQYTFTYKADKAGTVTIPATTIVVDGKRMSTQPRRITILPPDQSSRQRYGYGSSPFDDMDEMMEEMEEMMNQYMGGGSQQPQEPQQPQPTGKISAKDLIVTVNLSKTNLYEKEAVIATIKLYTKHNITNFQPTVMPQFEGFLSEEIPVAQQVAQQEHFRGENYYTVILKKCLLFPQKSGKLTINSGSYDVTLQTVDYVSNGFYATPVPREHAIKTTSNSVTVNVKPLPTPAPAGFNGAVGDFKVTAELTPERLRTNEAATYIFKVTGSGNLKHLAEPTVPFPVTVEEYTPTTDSDVSFTGNNISGTYTATYTIMPKELGKLVIPAWDFSYFNPATGRYYTVNLPSIERDVTKGLPSGASSGGGKVDTSEISDIRYLADVDESELSHEHEAMFFRGLYWLAYIVALAALLASVVLYRRHIKTSADVQGRRTRKARSVAARRLRKAHDAMRSHNNDAFYDALSAAVWGYLADKLHMPASTLTRDNIAEALAGVAAPPELVNDVINVLDECEMARFTPEHSDSEVSTLYKNASSAIDRLERLKPVKKTVATNDETRYVE